MACKIVIVEQSLVVSVLFLYYILTKTLYVSYIKDSELKPENKGLSESERKNCKKDCKWLNLAGKDKSANAAVRAISTAPTEVLYVCFCIL